MRTRQLLVTGSNGLIGSEMVKHLFRELVKVWMVRQ
jgi:FlaA1/EpsC-like NDP-sugar epimerase